MKNQRSLLFETSRIKNLMGISVISEIKLPNFINDIISKNAPTVKFTHPEEIVIVKNAFPDMEKNINITDVDVLNAAKNVDLNLDQIDVILKLNNKEISEKLFDALAQDVEIKKQIELIMRGKELGKDVDFLKDKLKTIVPERELDNFLERAETKLSDEIRIKNQEKAKKDLEQNLVRGINATKTLEQASEILDEIPKDKTAIDLIGRKDLMVYLKAAKKTFATLKDVDFDVLNPMQQLQVDAAVAQIKKLNPNAYTYLLYLWRKYPKISKGLCVLITILLFGLENVGYFLGSVIPGLGEGLKAFWDGVNQTKNNSNTDGKNTGDQNTSDETTTKSGPCPSGKSPRMRGGKIICI